MIFTILGLIPWTPHGSGNSVVGLVVKIVSLHNGNYPAHKAEAPLCFALKLLPLGLVPLVSSSSKHSRRISSSAGASHVFISESISESLHKQKCRFTTTKIPNSTSFTLVCPGLSFYPPHAFIFRVHHPTAAAVLSTGQC